MADWKWEGACYKCQKPAKAPFVPSDNNPAYCKSCYFESKDNSAGDAPCQVGRHNKTYNSVGQSSGGQSDEAFGQYLLRLKEDGYFDTDSQIRREYLVDSARLVARVLNGNGRGLSGSQLNNFYRPLRLLASSHGRRQDWPLVRRKVQQLYAQVNYAAERDSKLEPFKEFINANAEQAEKSEKHFREGFMMHFECIVGFSKKN